MWVCLRPTWADDAVIWICLRPTWADDAVIWICLRPTWADDAAMWICDRPMWADDAARWAGDDAEGEKVRRRGSEGQKRARQSPGMSGSPGLQTRIGEIRTAE
jgi:hypothetical protein